MNGIMGLRERACHLLTGAMLVIGLAIPGRIAAQQTNDGLWPDPILRIEAGSHTARIVRIVTDREIYMR